MNFQRGGDVGVLYDLDMMNIAYIGTLHHQALQPIKISTLGRVSQKLVTLTFLNLQTTRNYMYIFIYDTEMEELTAF